MEKQISVYGYWLGLACTVIAIVLRALTAIGIGMHATQAGGTAISYNSFYHGAVLFLLLAMASTGVAWLKSKN